MLSYPASRGSRLLPAWTDLVTQISLRRLPSSKRRVIDSENFGAMQGEANSIVLAPTRVTGDRNTSQLAASEEISIYKLHVCTRRPWCGGVGLLFVRGSVPSPRTKNTPKNPGPFRELNPGPRAPEARIIPLDQTAALTVLLMNGEGNSPYTKEAYKQKQARNRRQSTQHRAPGCAKILMWLRILLRLRQKTSSIEAKERKLWAFEERQSISSLEPRQAWTRPEPQIA